MLRFGLVICFGAGVGIGLGVVSQALDLGVTGLYGAIALAVLAMMPMLVWFAPFVRDAWNTHPPTGTRRSRERIS